MPDAPAAPANPPPAPSTDPFTANLLKSLNVALDEKGELKQIEPAKLDTQQPIVTATRTLGEIVVQKQDEAKNAAPPAPAAPAEPPKPAEQTPAAKPPEQPAPAVTPKKVEVVPPTSEKLRTQLEELRAKTAEPTPKPIEPAPAPAAPAPQSEDEYERGLTDEQKLELELARYAEKHGHPDQAKKFIDFFKRVDKYHEDHPELTPDSDDFQAFVKSNRPTYNNRRKIEMAMIEDRAVARAKEELSTAHQEEMAKLRARVEANEIMPQIEKTIDTFRTSLSDPEIPAEIKSIEPEVLTVMQEKGYQEAAKLYPIEAPLVKRATQAAAEHLKIVNNITRFDRNNPVHQYLVNFVDRQEQILASRPIEEQTRNGRTFMPTSKYIELAQKNPEEAKKHWVLNDSDILDLLRVDAHQKAKMKMAELEAAGFVKTKKATTPAATPAPTPPATPATVPNNTPQPPKAGSSASPGAAIATPPKDPGAEFLNRLLPGYKMS